LNVIASSSCTATATSFARTEEYNAIVEAGRTTSVYACHGKVNDKQVKSKVEDTAKALASAIAVTYATCTTTGETAFGCATSEAQATARAEAAAEAWAKAAASASDCGCFAEAKASAVAIKKVIVEANAKSYSRVCISGDATATADGFTESFVEATITALAEVFASAFADDGVCKAFSSALAQITTEVTSEVETGVTTECEGDECSTTSEVDGTVATSNTDSLIVEAEAAQTTSCYKLGGLNWVYKDTAVPIVAKYNAVKCCKKAVRGGKHIKSRYYKKNCEGYNFPTFTKPWQCGRVLRKCKKWGACDCYK